MNILAIDLGTKTGLCFNRGTEPVVIDHWTLATAKEIHQWHETHKDRELDPRIPRLFARLSALIDGAGIHQIVFEDVEFAKTLRQCQLWSSFRTVVWMVAALKSLPCHCVPVQTLKKFATGSGFAEKEAMGRALLKRKTFKHRVPNLTDDEIDATFIWIWAMQYLEHKLIE